MSLINLGNKQKKPKTKKKMKRVFEPMPNKPPTYDPKMVFRKTFRYQQNDTTALTAIDTQDLFFMVSTPVSTGNIVSLISALRLVSIKLWQTGTTTGPGSISIEAQNTGTGLGVKPIILSDTSYSPNTFARLTYVPNKLSTLGMWQNTISTTGISGFGRIDITANQGDIMDITIDLMMNNSATDFVLGSTYTTSAPIGNIIAAKLPVDDTNWTPLFIPF